MVQERKATRARDPRNRRDYVLRVRLSEPERELIEAGAEARRGDLDDGRGVVTTWAREVLLRAARVAARKG